MKFLHETSSVSVELWIWRAKNSLANNINYNSKDVTCDYSRDFNDRKAWSNPHIKYTLMALAIIEPDYLDNPFTLRIPVAPNSLTSLHSSGPQENPTRPCHFITWAGNDVTLENCQMRLRSSDDIRFIKKLYGLHKARKVVVGVGVYGSKMLMIICVSIIKSNEK